MSGNSIFGKGVLSALAVALVTTAIPATAFAQDERRAERSGRSWGGGEARRDGGGQHGDMQRGGADFRSRGAAQAQVQTPQVQTQRAQAQQQQRPVWNGTVRPERAATEQRAAPRQPGWDGTRWNPTNQSQARAGINGRSRDGDRDTSRNGSSDRDRNWSNNRDQNPSWNGRNPTYSDRDRNRDYRRDDNRNGWSNRDSWNSSRNNTQRWSNNWRQDRRYDWSGYRSSNRNHFRMPRYFAPYRGYNYSSLSIGFVLNSGFYGSRYWINDPWSYRLPPAYAGYRWVRYYDDVLLVDTYTGEVADVIRNFFW